MAHELEKRIAEQVRDVALGAGEQVVDAEHLVALGDQPVDEMRAEESGPAGDQDALAAVGEARHGYCAATVRPASACFPATPRPMPR